MKVLVADDDADLRDLIAFTLLIMVLIFRPYGIMGERMAKKRA